MSFLQLGHEEEARAEPGEPGEGETGPLPGPASGPGTEQALLGKPKLLNPAAHTPLDHATHRHALGRATE